MPLPIRASILLVIPAILAVTRQAQETGPAMTGNATVDSAAVARAAYAPASAALRATDYRRARAEACRAASTH
jgi:hypothetical protein